MFQDSTVSVNLKGLEKFQSEIDQQLAGKDGPIRKAFKLWGVRYRSYIQLRFDSYSKGGGDWRALSLATIKARRKGSNKNKSRSSLARNKAKPVNAGGSFTILRDKGLLFAAVNPVFNGAPGAIEEQIPFGIKAGFGGPQKHDSGGTATIADIANFHQKGAEPRMPQRKIIVEPDAKLLGQMAGDMTNALQEIANGTTG